MKHSIAGRSLSIAGALALTAAVAACAAPPPPAPPPAPAAGFSGSSTPPNAALTPRDDYGYGSSAPMAQAASHSYAANRATPLRQGPRDGFPVMALLPPGAWVTPDGYVGGSWWQVHTKYGTGWVYSRDLSPS